jgi:hypothetical protein
LSLIDVDEDGAEVEVFDFPLSLRPFPRWLGRRGRLLLPLLLLDLDEEGLSLHIPKCLVRAVE